MSANECPIQLDQLSPNVQRSVGPEAPAQLKAMAARGLSPMAPSDLVVAQYYLTFDSDAKVAQLAKKGLGQMDVRIATAVLGDQNLPEVVLGFLAEALANKDAFVEQLLLNPKTPSSAFIEVARVCSEHVCETIANNQKRLLQTPEIARALHDNANAIQSTKDRVIDFLVREGAHVEGLRAWDDAFMRLNGEERIKAAEKVELPDEALRYMDDDERGERRLIDEDEEELGEEEKVDQPLEVLLRTLNVAQKVAMATKGNRSARAALMRDTNRLVALAAITSPSVTEPEVIAAAQSKIVHTDVVAHIGRDKKNNWVRNYQVKVALVSNPKMPLPDAMKLVPTLNPRDLKQISKSRNVPMGVRNMAGNLIRQKRR